MIKKSLLLTLLLALFAPWAAMGQETLTVYDGTTTNRNVPMYVYYFDAYARSQYIIPAADLQDMACGTINSIHFYTSYTSAYTTACDVTVRMKEVDYTTLSSFVDMSDASTVYNGVAEFTLINGKAEITFSFTTPFAYNGGNLLIDCKNDATDNYKSIYFYGQSVSYNSAVYGNNSSATPTSGGTTQQFIPKTTFTYTPSPYAPPASISYTNNEPGNTTVSWTEPNTTETVTGYGYRYKLTSDTDWPAFESVDATATSVTLAALAYGEEYEFEVKALYGENESCVTTQVTFTTLEACMTPENLEITDVTAHAATLTWTEGYGDGQWVLQYKLSTEEEYTSVDVALADLPYTLTGLTAESTYNVLIAPVCDATKTITSNFTTTVACFAPTNLAVEANAQTATFTWESNVNNYEIAHATDATADPIDNIVGTATENTYSMSDLTLDTDHYFWVRSNCGSEGYSQWAGPVSVHIGYCVPNPSSHDGKGITGVSFGTGDYVVTNGDGSASLPASAPYYGNYSSMIGAVQAGVESTIAITTGTNSYPYTFVIWVDFDNSLSFEDSEVVYIGKASSGNGTLNATITIPATQELGDYRMRIYGADSYFTSFYNNGNPDYTKPHDPCSSGSYRHAHDYTLRVLEAPSCLTPTGLTVSDVTAHEATISWTSDAAAWLVMLNDNMEDLAYVEEATYTFTNLTPETTYTVKVQADCDGTYSEWTNAISFTTLVACPAPTGLEVTYEGGTTATLAWTENGTATEWDVEFDTDPEFDYYTTVNVSGTPSTELAGLALATTYYVRVKTYCGTEGYSTYSNTVNFTTDLCLADDMCELTFTLTDAWGDGWNGNAIVVTDVLTGEVLATMANENLNGTSGSGENEVNIKTLAVCDGREIQFSWTSGSYVNETSYIVTDINGEVIVEGSGAGFDPFTYTVNCAPPTCLKPTNLTVNYTGGATAIVTWEGEADVYNIDVNGTVTEGVTSPYTLEDLAPATDYAVKVQADCGNDGTSEWTNAVNFTGLTPAPILPTDVEVTPTATTGEVVWVAGENNGSWNLRWRPYVDPALAPVLWDLPLDGYAEQVEGWIVYDADGDGNNWGLAYSSNDQDDVCFYSASYESSALTPDNWLVTPEVTLGGTLKFETWNRSSSYPDKIMVYVCDNPAFESFDEFVAISDFIQPTTAHDTIELSLSEFTGTGRIAFRHYDCNNQWMIYLDNIEVAPENAVEIPEWTVVENVESPYTIEDLTPVTEYEVQVMAINEEGDRMTDWTESVVFTTLEGQTFEKIINGYGEGNGNWYLIATPIGNVKPANVTNMIADPEDDYDLYAWDGATTEVNNDNEPLVWRNFKVGEFTQLEPGKGYLYANKNTVTLTFFGTPYDGNGTFDLTYDEANETACLNLVGNPYAETASIDGNRSFYTMNGDGDKFIASTSNTIEAMEGIFVVAGTEGDQVTFTPESGDKSANLALNLSQGLGIIDRAIVRFDEGSQLPKFQFRANSTKIYIPQEGKDYAVVSGSEMGEMPVNFKAESNGSYTMSFTIQEVSFNYLHLIDNMTGADVDLLVNPSYSFDANTTDYASRFKLVFATGNNSDDNFAFYSNGSFVISNEGNAVLQVVDVTGRILNNETINGSANVHVDAAPGVYMLRLINGDNVKVQKVVVK